VIPIGVTPRSSAKSPRAFCKVTCVSHALSFVKSFWPQARLELLAQGAAANYSKEQFSEYLLEARPVAEKIVESVIYD
jgi:hypothetical protein